MYAKTELGLEILSFSLDSNSGVFLVSYYVFPFILCSRHIAFLVNINSVFIGILPCRSCLLYG